MIKIVGRSIVSLCLQLTSAFGWACILAGQACLRSVRHSFLLRSMNFEEQVGDDGRDEPRVIQPNSYFSFMLFLKWPHYSLLSFLFVSFFTCAQQLVLNITDMRDAPASVIEVGVPFKIKISVHGFSIQGKELAIKGLEQVVVDAHQEQISIINGVRSCVHTYCARIDKIGSYVVGPALAHYRGAPIESEHMKLAVIKGKSRSVGKKEAFFARLTCEKETIFLGENVYCHIHFYAKNPDARLTNLLAPSFNVQVDNTQYQGPFESVETIQGTQYICRHVQWICCPKTVGELVIPAYTIVYTLPSDDRAQFGGFSAFFGMRPTQHLLYTNAATLNVKPLPAYIGAQSVQSIGVYSTFELAVKQQTIQVGQALVVTLQLTGSGDINALTAPELQGLPSTCKQYESQVTTMPVNDATSVKTFEYILQASVPGSLKIPEQKFVFFDTNSGRYKTLTTKGQEILVTPPPAPSADETQALANQAPYVQGESASQLDSPTGTLASSLSSGSAHLNVDEADVCSIMTGQWYSHPCRSMPWWLLLLLFVLPPLGALLCVIYRKLIFLYAARSYAKTAEHAFVHARACLLQAEEKRAYTDLYPLFSQLISVRMPHSQQVSIDEMVRKSLGQAGFSEQLCDEWQQFFSDCAAFVFLDNSAHADPLIFKQAHYWLSILEQAL